MKRLAAALAGLARVVRLLTTLTLLASVAFNFVNIVGRYFFNSPIEWGEEVMLFMMVGMVFFGAVVISAQGRHIRMDVAVELLPVRMRTWFLAFGIACEGVAAAVVVWIGVPVIEELVEFDQRAEASGLPMAIPQAIVPIGMALIALTCAARLVLMLAGQPADVAGGHATDPSALLAGD